MAIPTPPDADERWPLRSLKRLVRGNALSLVCLGLFASFLVAQSLAGWRAAVGDVVEHGGAGVGYWHT